MTVVFVEEILSLVKKQVMFVAAKAKFWMNVEYVTVIHQMIVYKIV